MFKNSIIQNIKQSLFTIIICLILLGGINYVMAWTAPSASPPDNNVDAPINVGSTAQTKTGSFRSNSDMRATIFYDQNNTGYYTNPASNSWLYRLYSYDIRADIFYDRNNTGYYVNPAGNFKV